ncbi:MAG TPA: HlyD family efflux transporter periplasmic adaptor subunit [Opitutaceae bacterium]|nr:HlyD family efflux transporter periplasmic adaptor subunit [Opitutaceae bacterium]
MDIPRPSAAKEKRRKRIILWGGVLLGVIVITVLLGQLKPAAPTVERNLVWIDSVKEGPMVRQVRGLGTLVPQDIRFIAARTNGRVDEILLRPGAPVEPDTVLMILINPDVEQAALNSELQLAGALAELEFLKAQVERELLSQEASSARVKSEYEQARLQEQVNSELFKEGLVATVILKQSQVASEEAATRWALEQRRIDLARKTVDAQIAPKEAEVSRLRSQAALAKRDFDALTVRASYAGVLQALPLEVGQQVVPGSTLARVADPTRLKAEIRIAETQAKDVQAGQIASIDTRNGVVAGVVARVDPAVVNGTVLVDVTLTGDLPRGARPDLSVDGTVELERLDKVIFVGRPAFGQERSTVGIFRLSPDGSEATRVPVQLGRSSVNTIEIVQGLAPGDRVILSDMSNWENTDRVRLN